MKNTNYQYFTPGPVAMSAVTQNVGVGQLPYFRTPEFSEITKECESMLISLCSAPKNSRVVFLTASGTGAMDAAIANLIDKQEMSTVINAGGFGQRFVDILEFYKFRSRSINIDNGKSFLHADLSLENDTILESSNLIYNLHETTTGALHNINTLSEMSKVLSGVHIVDAISSFLCDDIDMEKHNIDALILSSQKALALPPGLSMIVLSPRAIERIVRLPSKSYYFNLKDYLINGERGQSPYTPAVGIMLQLHSRLQELCGKKYSAWVEKCHSLAIYFRKGIESSCFAFFAESPSNAITTLDCRNCEYSALEVVSKLKLNKILVTPNGGELSHSVFRVGHMGNLNTESYDNLISILNEIKEKK